MPLWFYSDGKVSKTFLDHQELTSSTATFTFSGLNFGAADTARYLVACFTWQGAGSPALTGGTIGGVTASILVQDAGTAGGRRTAICIALVPTGASGVAVATMASGCLNASVALYSISGIISATASSTATSTANPPTATINISAGGIAIAVAMFGGTSTWTGLTEDCDNTFGAGSSQSRSSASSEFLTTQTGLVVTDTFSIGGGNADACFVVFNPP